MQNEVYMLVFQGDLVDGFDLERVKRNLKELFKVSQEKVEQLFSLPAVVVKRDLTHELAQKFQRQLQQRGLITVIRPMAGSNVVPVANDMEEKPMTAEPIARARSAPTARHVSREQDASAMPFRFEGKAGEYFKIWIVNILLSILTLGIYSAWAKVRNHRYFYSNTFIGKHSFEYLADPLTILKGRIVAAVFLGAYVLAGEFMPLLGLAFMLIFLVALPWLVCRSLAFRNQNTAFRNIRFGFDATYWDAFKVYVLWGLASMLTLGLLLPYAIYRQKQFVVSHSRYGTARFVAEFSARDFYGIYLRALGIIAVAIAVFFLVPVIGVFLAIPLYLVAFAFITAGTTNLTFNNTLLDTQSFESTLKAGRLAWIHFSNAMVTGLTLGLAIPWVMVRLAKYHAQCLRMIAEGDIDSFIAAEENKVSSLGEEIGDAFDLGIGM